MIFFSSKYSATVDGKGRIVLPAPYKKEMGDSPELRFVVEKDPYEGCLNLYPYTTWESKVATFLQRMNIDNFEEGQLVSRYSEDVVILTIAENGRLNIPDEMLEYAGITKEALFTGQGSRMRIWEPARHQASRLTDEKFRQSFKELLGGTR